MAVEIAGVSGAVLTVKVTGRLAKAELERAQASAAEVIRTHGTVRLLVIATGFLGWTQNDDWNDVSFPITYGKHIEKIAIVGDKQWKELVLAFAGKGFRPATIEYFATGDLPKARGWLDSP